MTQAYMEPLLVLYASEQLAEGLFTAHELNQTELT